MFTIPSRGGIKAVPQDRFLRQFYNRFEDIFLTTPKTVSRHFFPCRKIYHEKQEIFEEI